MSDRLPPIQGHSQAIVRAQAELPPPVAVLPTRQRQSPMQERPLHLPALPSSASCYPQRVGSPADGVDNLLAMHCGILTSKQSGREPFQEAKQGHGHKSCNKSHSLIFSVLYKDFSYTLLVNIAFSLMLFCCKAGSLCSDSP
ncbi:hypothetical protein PROFUN_03457 [Planoprotostelium fungivorum]|uniref:Uncharacterized protein n=1 Tax=Planoprotostelium fungivorum TaxID=1890364 RepID=A0A2P6MN63_9EUKA|nr:hypothetical protein PROFUN_03457 [Planoprotostelium fungivorum]